MENETIQYTFTQPVRGGYYYIVVEASSEEEAASVAAEVANSFKHLTGKLRFINSYPKGELVLESRMQARLDEMGYAHRFVPIHLLSYGERVGYRGLLPK